MTSPEPQAAPRTPKRVRIHHLQQWKDAGERWPMLTAYDFPTAQIFDGAGIPVLLVGDSAANNVLGYDSTVPVSVDELLMLTKAVVRGTSRALVVADLPFGSYQALPDAGPRDRGAVLQGGRGGGGQARGRRAVRAARSGRWPTPASRSWPTSGSPRRASTPSAGSACRAGARAPRS